MSQLFAEAVSAFGLATKAKLSNAAISGAPEDQLRGPLEKLIEEIAEINGFAKGRVKAVGETSLSDLKIRPDYAMLVDNALIGFVEVKAPGKGADPRQFTDAHDKGQWNKLKSLPNLLYTDGNSFSFWQDGKLVDKIVHLDGDVMTSGAKLAAPQSLLSRFNDFLTWKPIPPKTPRQLAEISARLCRLLRDEVTEQMALGNTALVGLATDWRKLLFPEATDAAFADGYAQAVTFGLLIARAKDISLADGIEHAATELRKTNSLIGTALRLLVESDENQQALATSLKTMTRVLDQVNWATISKDDPDAWLYFYEHFLEVYDNTLRKRTGSYYTPPEVVTAMLRLVDEVLRSHLFERSQGLASTDVTIADPAVGTGTYLLGALREIASIVADDMGVDAVPAAIGAAMQRLVGFEIQFGPFAVAQLRLIAELQELVATEKTPKPVIPELKLFITDTLGNPYQEEEYIAQTVQPIAKSRRDANVIKKGQKITVVIGNPPYKEKAKGRGGWVEAGAGGTLKAPMDRWLPPSNWGVSTHAKHLKNLYVYFWRWAAWKVFGAGHYAATGFEDKDEEGIVCFISVAGFLKGPGFQKMRDDLRRTCSDIWVIDCSPDGHQPDVPTRIFQGVQQPVCIVLAARKQGKDQSKPANVHFRALPVGKREEKFAALAKLSLKNAEWVDCPSGWRNSFLPEATGAWAEFPALSDFFIYNGSGVMPGRTWVIAPDRASLVARWQRLVAEKDADRKALLFHPHLRNGEPGDKHVKKSLAKGLAGHEERTEPVALDERPVIEPIRYGYRSFDRQWIIPDARLINQTNPALWNGFSQKQIYLSALEAHSPTSGPSISISGLIPDLHLYKGSFGGRAHPLWRDGEAKQSNVAPALLHHLAEAYGQPITPEDVMAYLAAVMAHPAFTARFQPDLVQPGLRVPLTADASLFSEAVALGREVIWLHCYGERFADADAGRPKGAPRMPKGQGPTIPSGGEIPPAPEPLPNTMEYDAPSRRLKIGKGHIDNVPPEVWAYEVSGKQVVWQWFSYRKLDRTKPQIGDKRPPSPLDSIQPEGWLPEYTSDLLDLLHVLGRLVALEPAQADLMDRILAAPLIKASELQKSGQPAG